MLSDRRRVELILPGRTFWRLAWQLACHDVEAGRIARPEDHAGLGPILAGLDAAAHEPLLGVEARKADQLWRRACRVQGDAFRVLEDRPIATAYMVAVRWLQDLTDAGALEIGDGPFLGAYNALAEAIGADPGNLRVLGGVDRSATRAARRLADWLAGQGYYREYRLARHGGATGGEKGFCAGGTACGRIGGLCGQRRGFAGHRKNITERRKKALTG
jgi:hypothetical protein